MRRAGRHLVAAALAALLLAPGTVLAQDGQRPELGVAWTARVTRVVDGDSIWVRPDAGGRRLRLRLDGIDAPEICQRSGAESRAAMQALALDQPVQVTVWAWDRYGRAVATVLRLSDQADVAAQLVSQGWAWSEGYRGRLGRYWREELAARGAERGVFAERWPETPTEFRRRHGPCATPAR